LWFKNAAAVPVAAGHKSKVGSWENFLFHKVEQLSGYGLIAKESLVGYSSVLEFYHHQFAVSNK
jgi:hypothetical protein